MGDDSVEQVEVIPTGSIALNVAALEGVTLEVESSKSMARSLPVKQHWLSTPLLKHKKPAVSLLLLMPNTLSTVSMQPNWELTLTILYISQPDNGEQALEIAEQLIRSSAIDIIVIDSVAALTPKAEIEGDMGDNKVGLQARLMSQALT